MAEKKKRKYIPILFILCLAVLFNQSKSTEPQYRQAMSTGGASRELSSHSILMIELDGNRVCYAKNPNERLPVASLTKIMTALVLIENTEDLEAQYTFTDKTLEGMAEKHASVAGFASGERVSVRDMLYGIMLPSGGDAALGAAEYIAGDEAGFVELMNQKAENIGMHNTRFSDATGLDDTDNYSSASDMALLFSSALKNDIFYDVVTSAEYLTAATSQHKNGILLKSTLNAPMKEYHLEGKILGGKTGYTTGAGLCLASYAELEGHRYILVTLGAGDGSKYPSYHFEDAAVLYDEYYLT